MRAEVERVLREVEKAISGKREEIGKVLLALLADGHILLDDVPGVGKTTLALALSRAVGLDFGRIQCTPDLLPSDIVGFSLYDRESGAFVYRPGAVNGANLLLADEINRTSSRTQSALLEAMEERQVTVDGATYPLPRPFVVIATENRVGAAGTQNLPFAQMDRFLTRLRLGYPDMAAQVALLRDRQDREPLEEVQSVLTREELLRAQAGVRAVRSAEAVLEYIARLAVASRESDLFEAGISPRGALFLDRAAKARAWMQGRDYATPADVQAVFADVCGHRVLPGRRAAAEGPETEGALDALLRSVPTPEQGR